MAQEEEEGRDIPLAVVMNSGKIESPQQHLLPPGALSPRRGSKLGDGDEETSGEQDAMFKTAQLIIEEREVGNEEEGVAGHPRQDVDDRPSQHIITKESGSEEKHEIAAEERADLLRTCLATEDFEDTNEGRQQEQSAPGMENISTANDTQGPSGNGMESSDLFVTASLILENDQSNHAWQEEGNMSKSCRIEGGVLSIGERGQGQPVGMDSARDVTSGATDIPLDYSNKGDVLAFVTAYAESMPAGGMTKPGEHAAGAGISIPVRMVHSAHHGDSLAGVESTDVVVEDKGTAAARDVGEMQGWAEGRGGAREGSKDGLGLPDLSYGPLTVPARYQQVEKTWTDSSVPDPSAVPVEIPQRNAEAQQLRPPCPLPSSAVDDVRHLTRVSSSHSYHAVQPEDLQRGLPQPLPPYFPSHQALVPPMPLTRPACAGGRLLSEGDQSHEQELPDRPPHSARVPCAPHPGPALVLSGAHGQAGSAGWQTLSLGEGGAGHVGRPVEAELPGDSQYLDSDLPPSLLFQEPPVPVSTGDSRWRRRPAEALDLGSLHLCEGGRERGRERGPGEGKARGERTGDGDGGRRVGKTISPERYYTVYQGPEKSQSVHVNPELWTDGGPGGYGVAASRTFPPHLSPPAGLGFPPAGSGPGLRPFPAQDLPFQGGVGPEGGMGFGEELGHGGRDTFGSSGVPTVSGPAFALGGEVTRAHRAGSQYVQPHLQSRGLPASLPLYRPPPSSHEPEDRGTRRLGAFHSTHRVSDVPESQGPSQARDEDGPDGGWPQWDELRRDQERRQARQRQALLQGRLHALEETHLAQAEENRRLRRDREELMGRLHKAQASSQLALAEAAWQREQEQQRWEAERESQDRQQQQREEWLRRQEEELEQQRWDLLQGQKEERRRQPPPLPRSQQPGSRRGPDGIEYANAFPPSLDPPIRADTHVPAELEELDFRTCQPRAGEEMSFQHAPGASLPPFPPSPARHRRHQSSHELGPSPYPPRQATADAEGGDDVQGRVGGWAATPAFPQTSLSAPSSPAHRITPHPARTENALRSPLGSPTLPSAVKTTWMAYNSDNVKKSLHLDTSPEPTDLFPSSSPRGARRRRRHQGKEAMQCPLPPALHPPPPPSLSIPWPSPSPQNRSLSPSRLGPTSVHAPDLPVRGQGGEESRVSSLRPVRGRRPSLDDAFYPQHPHHLPPYPDPPHSAFEERRDGRGGGEEGRDIHDPSWRPHSGQGDARRPPSPPLQPAWAKRVGFWEPGEGEPGKVEAAIQDGFSSPPGGASGRETSSSHVLSENGKRRERRRQQLLHQQAWRHQQGFPAPDAGWGYPEELSLHPVEPTRQAMGSEGVWPPSSHILEGQGSSHHSMLSTGDHGEGRREGGREGGWGGEGLSSLPSSALRRTEAPDHLSDARQREGEDRLGLPLPPPATQPLAPGGSLPSDVRVAFPGQESQAGNPPSLHSLPPFATEYSAFLERDYRPMEDALLQLNMERTQLKDELDRLGLRRLRKRKDLDRLAWVEGRLKDIGREASRLKILLKDKPS
ncbi:hypothetical protein NSK_006120 [Nannochloropsis salina CCMP1776]|uniref:Uncharacterized protein n=1 Tax=Nannochloropsis salina CCMP1776 TaxID=1027361 RepID=A0A4D9CUU6_9STRA|nr:hypothetical protein NSK_006120 [Nannochloropsis salina CCMP1776]|eukprot:TFJ82696.1 hypothetical protein NSK_006120 [Nannochloropsis salina CCMP1776]